MNNSIFMPDVRMEPWWWEDIPKVTLSENKKIPKKVDVAIIGSGFTGLSSALTLSRAGRDVLVLESGELGAGASSRNGGMIGSGHRANYSSLKNRYGHEAAIGILKEGIASFDFTTSLIEKENIDCKFSRTGRFLAAWNQHDYEKMAQERNLFVKLIGLDAEMIPRSEQQKELTTDSYFGGCVFHNHGGLHPALFHRGLQERVLSAGASIIQHIHVKHIINENKNEFTLVTSKGRLIARNIIVATNGYTSSTTPYFQKRIVPVASFMIATEPLPSDLLKQLIPNNRVIVESRARHCYYRTSPDGKRILFGARASFTVMDPRRSGKCLHTLMSNLFPQLSSVRISHSWNGFVAMTKDQIPHIGCYDGIHYAMGYNGSGVAMAPYLGFKVANMMLGNSEAKTPFNDTRFSAIPFYNGYPWFLPFIELYYRFKDWRQGSS